MVGMVLYLGNSRDIVVKAFEAGLGDPRQLVVRGLLEIVVSCFPIDLGFVKLRAPENF